MSIQGLHRKVDRIIVVDNASTDGTPELLESDFPEVRVLRNSQNTGGAGGFHTGLKELAGAESDYIWLMDDDAWVEPGSLDPLLEVLEGVEPRPAFVCSRVIDESGMTINAPHVDFSGEKWDSRLAEGLLPLRACSFVSVIFSTKSVRIHGLPLFHYFLWFDDMEYTLRLSEDSPGWYVPRSVVRHPRPGGLARPDILLEPSERRLPLYRHLFSNMIETKARHPKRFGHSWLMIIRIISRFAIILLARRQFRRLGILLRGTGAGIVNIIKLKRRQP